MFILSRITGTVSATGFDAQGEGCGDSDTDSAVNTPIALDINDRHFPLFLQGRNLMAEKASMVLVVKEREPAGTVSIR